MKKFFYFHLISTVALSSFFLKGAERKFRVTHGPNGSISISGEGSFCRSDYSGLSQAQILEMLLSGKRPTSTTQGVEVSLSEAIRRIPEGNFGAAAKPAVAEGSQEARRQELERRNQGR